jgi:hypothetical protein
MAQITIDIPDDVLMSSKPLQTLVREVQEALVFYWLARGELSPEQAISWHKKQKESSAFWQWVTSMPDVGEDVDFARTPDIGRDIAITHED